MRAEITIGKGDVNTVWDKIINRIAKEYHLTQGEVKALKNYNMISLSSEVFELTFQKTKNMVGLIVSPMVTDDYNPVKLYVVTSDEDVASAVLRQDEDLFNKLYSEFLAVLDDEGLGMDMDINIMEKVEKVFWKYMNVYNYLGYSGLKFNRLQLEESQDTGNGRVLLKRRWMFAIMKMGTVHPLLEVIAFNTQTPQHEKGYL